MRVHPKMIYATLRWVCVLYLVPIGYLVSVFRYHRWLDGESLAWMASFLKTDLIEKAIDIWAVVWFVLFCFLFCYRMRDYYIWKRRLDDNIPITFGKEAKIFYDVCWKMGIPAGKVSLERNVLIQIPMIFGIEHPCVILPERKYNSTELRMILHHELSHYKHKDLWFKQLTVWISIVHSTNLVTYFLLNHVNLWSECMADALALESSGNLHNAKPYFHNILHLVPDEHTAGKEKYIFSALFEREDTLQRRIQFMKVYQKMKFAGKIVTMALTAAFICMTTTTAFAASKGVSDLHSDLYQYTEETADATVAEDGMIEYHCDIEDLNTEGLEIIYHDEFDEPIYNIQATFGPYGETWTCKPNTRHISGPINLPKNNSIINASSTVVPNNKNYKLGVMDNSGHATYVRGQGAAAHNFTGLSKGNYRVFVQNDYTDGTTLTAVVGYSYYYDYDGPLYN